MQAIWLLDEEGEKFITASLAMKRCPELQRLKLTTVLTLINRLQVKGFVKVQKIGHSNGYIPIISSEDYRKFAYGDFLEKVYRSDKMDLVSTLLSTEDFTKEELKEIKALITKTEKGDKK
jgi:predicted transcriptional regulator